ncbi:hypothetical protein [Desulfosediminicola flagellatus]|uniref:hypothetical protein n=1 Tax=Desulfosediminicola flagellatus TaxID=2569541 RepID=UPI0010AC6882|nr:hypothetical protein [Desulfosediminicola flagellatus]
MRINFLSLCCLFLTLFLSGCLDTKQVYTLNPDGSGKVVHEAKIPLNSPITDDDVNPEIQLKEAVLSELKNAKGIEAWDDISYKYMDEETIYFKGTAYFKDLSQLKFFNSGITISLFDKVIMFRDDKQFSIELKSSEPSSKNTKTPEQESETVKSVLTDAEVEEQLAEAQKKILEAKAMLTGLLADIRLDRTFYLPGTITTSSNFQRNTDGSVRNNFEGTKLIELITNHLDDEEWLRQQIKNGKKIDEDPLPAPHIVNGHLFGEKAPIKVVINTTDAPLFDYAAETAQAKVHYDALLSKLEPLKAPAPIKIDPETVGKFSVVGFSYVAFADSQNGIQPFGNREGYTLAVMGTLPEKAISLKSARLETALTDTGANLLPESDWDQKIHFPTLGKDGRTVQLDLKILKPANNLTSLQKISGTLSYMASSEGYTFVDLGISEFKEGVIGNKFGAKVVTASTDYLEVSVDIVGDSIKSIELYDTQGKNVGTMRRYNSSSATTHIKFSPMNSENLLPLQGKIRLEIVEDFKIYEMEFSLTDVPLFGM